MKSALLLALALASAAPTALAQSRPEAPIRSTPFPDVPRDHWAFDAVEQLRKVGIIRGYPPQGTFHPPAARTQPAKKTPNRSRTPRR